MKSKILILSLISVFIFSCKSDDESSDITKIPAEERLIQNINFFDDTDIALSYNPDKTVETINFAGQAIFFFNYSENQISTIEVTGAIGNGMYTFTYDNNDRISAFAFNDEVTPVVWNEADRSYFYENENFHEVTITLKPNNDIEKIKYVEAGDNDPYSINYIYEESKKGTMTNSNEIATAIEMIFPHYGLEIYTGTLAKKPIKIVAGSVMICTYNNTYDDQDFVSASTLSVSGTSAEPSPIIYTYIKL